MVASACIPCERVRRVRVVGLVQIAAWAGEGQVLLLCSPAASPRRDVFDMKRRTLERLAHPAILTAVPGALPDQSGEGNRNAHAGRLPRRCSASARNSEI